MKKRYRRLNRILRTVCNYYGLTKTEVTGPTRKAHIMYARHIYSYISYQLGYTMAETANFINRDRNTSRHSIQEITDQMKFNEYGYDQNVKSDIEYLTKKLRNCRKIRRK